MDNNNKDIMKRVRFSKDEISILISALSMAGDDFNGHTDLTEQRAWKANNSAMKKLAILERRANKA